MKILWSILLLHGCGSMSFQNTDAHHVLCFGYCYTRNIYCWGVCFREEVIHRKPSELNLDDDEGKSDGPLKPMKPL